MARGLLTDRAVRAAKLVGAERLLADGDGLYLRLRVGRATDWLFIYTHNAKRRKLGLGSLADLSLANARVAVQQHRDQLIRGVDPQVARQLQRAQLQREELERGRRLTVRQLFDRWRGAELTPHIAADGNRVGRKDGGSYTLGQFERHVFPKLGMVHAQDMAKSDVLAIFDGIKAEGKLRTANVLLTDLKQMLRFAVAREIVTHNVLDGVLKKNVGGKAVVRNRALSLEELRTLAGLLPTSGLSDRAVAAVWLILATGCRIGELIGTTWADAGQDAGDLREVANACAVKYGVVNLVGRTWHLPDTKNQRAHTVHLSAFAVEQFEKLLQLRSRDEESQQQVAWVFPDRTGKRPVCVKSFSKQLVDRQRPDQERMAHRSKCTASLTLPGGKWTAHDLRRTAATIMARLGVNTDVIDECLNHMIASPMARVYVHDRREAEQARAFDLLGAKLSGVALGRDRASNVVPLLVA